MFNYIERIDEYLYPRVSGEKIKQGERKENLSEKDKTMEQLN